MKRLLRRCLGEQITLSMGWYMADFGRISRLRRAIFLLGLVLASIFVHRVWISADSYKKDHLSPPTAGRHRSSVDKRKPLSPCQSFSTTEKIKTILIWEMPFGDPAMVPENLFTGDLPTDLYDISWNSSACGNCKVTYDQGLFNESDAVIFHGLYPNDTGIAPSKSSKEQKYVWWSQESRLNIRLGSEEAEDFDWVMTPSRHSEVFSPYATFPWILKFLWLKERGSDVMAKFCEMKSLYQVEANELDDLLEEYFGDVKKKKYRHHSRSTLLEELLNKKLKQSAWIASNCRSRSAYNRMDIVGKMESYGMRIDKYGECNDARIDISRWDPSFFEILSRYKFYLSFENSLHCRDYMTEKLWFNALYSGAVPVIWGPHKNDVKAALPPKSYIHVEEFSSIKDLVKYLKYLDRNATAYSEYLEWRTWLQYLDKNGEYHPDGARKTVPRPSMKTRDILKKYAVMKPVGFCQMCLKLHTPNFCQKRPNRGIDNERPECLDEDVAEEVLQKLGVW